VNLDRSRDSNLTKGIFDALIACVTRDSNPPTKVYPEESISSAICMMFLEGHAARVREIVPGRIQHLVHKKALHLNKQAGGYVVETIIGKTNALENAAEFLKEEFGIETQELPPQDGNYDEERQRVFASIKSCHSFQAGYGPELVKRR
jgi:hypothetical protein